MKNVATDFNRQLNDSGSTSTRFRPMETAKLTFSNPLTRETSSEALEVVADQAYRFDVIGGPDKGNFDVLGGPDRGDFDVISGYVRSDFDVMSGSDHGDFDVMSGPDRSDFDVLGSKRSLTLQ